MFTTTLTFYNLAGNVNRPSTKPQALIKIYDSPNVKEPVASTLRSYGNNTMRGTPGKTILAATRELNLGISGLDIGIAVVDVGKKEEPFA